MRFLLSISLKSPHAIIMSSRYFVKPRLVLCPPTGLLIAPLSFLVAPPFPRGNFNLSGPERSAMEQYIQEALSSGHIRPSSSSVGAGFFFVEKKDKSLRPCIHYQELNQINVKDKYSHPLINSVFDSVQDAHIFTKLDLRKPTTWSAFVTATSGKLLLTHRLAIMSTLSCRSASPTPLLSLKDSLMTCCRTFSTALSLST